MNQIRYKDGYKYQLVEGYDIATGITGADFNGDFLCITPTGALYILPGYAWDGMSGPVRDTDKNQKASLVHDALYQLMRMGVLPPSAKERADELMYEILLRDGYNRVRAWADYVGVDEFGEPYTDPANRKPVLVAPLAEVEDHSVTVEAGDR